MSVKEEPLDTSSSESSDGNCKKEVEVSLMFLDTEW